MAEREMTAEEAEAAFKTFGNFILQIHAARNKYGYRSDVAMRQVANYLETLSSYQLNQIMAYYEYISGSYETIMLLIGIVLLKREAGIHE